MTDLPCRMQCMRALRSRSFALFWAGQTVSALGDGACTTALAWQVLLLTGSATVTGLVVIAQTLPTILFLLLGGVVADRFPKWLVMFCLDSGRALVVLVIAALAAAHLLQLWHLVLLVIFFGFVRSFFSPAYQSIIPHLVEKKDLAAANSLTVLSDQLQASLGSLAGAGCVALLGPAAAFAFDGLTFVVSALCLFALRTPAPSGSHHMISETPPPGGVRGAGVDLREGLSYVAGSTFLWVSIVIAGLNSAAGVEAVAVAFLKLVHDVYGQGIWLVGAVSATGGVGSLAALLFMQDLNPLSRQREVLMCLMLVGTGIATIMFSLPLPLSVEPLVACPAMALLNFGLAVYQILWGTLVQETVPSEKLGRFSSIQQLGQYGLRSVGFALAGMIADHLSPRWVFIGAGALNLGLSSLRFLQVFRLDRVKSTQKGYVATMEAIATLKDQISGLLDEPQAPLQHQRALRAQIAELKQLRTVQARLEELEQLRVVRARIEALKQLRATQARIEELELLRVAQARLEELKLLRVAQARLEELKLLRVAQARLEELKFLQTLQVRSTKEEEALVLEDSLHETLRELHASRGHNIFSSHFSR